jgi:hypothetical protein
VSLVTPKLRPLSAAARALADLVVASYPANAAGYATNFLPNELWCLPR